MTDTPPVIDPSEAPAADRAITVRLVDVKPERVDWLWPGYLPRGKVALLDGDPDKGKSTMTLDWAARISVGGVMPDGHQLERAEGVVIMSAEDGLADTIRPRLDAAGADVTRVVAFTEVALMDGSKRPPSLPFDLAHLETVMRDEASPLVIVDVLNAYLGAQVDSYKDTDVRRVMHALKDMAERTNACVLLLRHLTKGSGGANALYRGGGSIGIMGAARLGMIAAVDPDDEDRRVLAVGKSNLAAKPPALLYRLVSSVPGQGGGVAKVQWEGVSEHSADGLLVTRDDRDGADADDAVSVLRDVLASGPRWANDAIAAMRDAGFSKDQAKRAKAKLKVTTSKVGAPGDALSGWQWSLPHRREHEGSEGSGVPDVPPFAPLGTEPLPSEQYVDLPLASEHATEATWATEDPLASPRAHRAQPEYVDLPLDEVGRCRECDAVATMRDEHGPLCRTHRGAA
ncbi:MAG: AAA family ATPase [Acidimicrobiales bacterium]